MSSRTLRINELVQREISDILHRRYQAETAMLTITAVEVAPDLRTGLVYVAVIGDDALAVEKLRWLRRHAEEIRRAVGKHVILKWTPRFEYVLDASGERGARLLQLMDEIDRAESKE